MFFWAWGTAGLGAKADVEAYGNFSLKNGWKIKGVSVIQLLDDNPSDWEWKSGPPSIGSTNPYVKIHVWADLMGRIDCGLRITIEGPEGTDPYQ